MRLFGLPGNQSTRASAALLCLALLSFIIALASVSPAVASKLQTFNRVGHTSRINCIAFSPDKKLLAAGDEHAVKIWDVVSCQKLHTLIGPGDAVQAVAFSSDGRRITSSYGGSSVKVWDVISGRELTASKDATYANMSSVVKTAEGSIKCMAVTADGTLGASTDGYRDLFVWNLKSGKRVGIMKGSNYEIASAAISCDGKTIAAACGDKIRLWDVDKGGRNRILLGGPHSASLVAFSPDGGKIACGGRDDQITIWDVQSGRRLRILYGGSNFFTLSFNTDGSKIIASDFSHVVVWDAVTGQRVKSYPTGRRFGMCSAMSPDSKLVAVGYNSQIRLLEADTGTELRRFWSSSGSISSARDVTFSPDGKTAVFASDDGTAKLFDVSSGAELRTFKGDSQAISSVAFSRDGKWLAIGDKYRGVKLWEVNSPDEPVDLAVVNTAVYSLSFTADGRYLVTASHDSTINLWDISKKKLAGTINFLGGAEWIASDEHGNFDGSEYCEVLRTFRHHKGYSDLSKLSDRHWQPGLLGRLLSVRSTASK